MTSWQEENKECLACEFQENLDILRQISFFSSVPLERLKLFAYICTREKFKAGEYLFRRGDDDGQAFFIISGAVSLVFPDEQSEEVLRGFVAGDFIGGLSLLGSIRRIFSLRAENDLECLMLTREKFKTTMQQFPELLPKIVKALVENIGAWEERCFAGRTDDCSSCRNSLGVSLV
jgi:CRP-like cAMP-binding protein